MPPPRDWGLVGNKLNAKCPATLKAWHPHGTPILVHPAKLTTDAAKIVDAKKRAIIGLETAGVLHVPIVSGKGGAEVVFNDVNVSGPLGDNGVKAFRVVDQEDCVVGVVRCHEGFHCLISFRVSGNLTLI